MNPDIWNEDGTPKLPGPRDRSDETMPFADLTADQIKRGSLAYRSDSEEERDAYVNYAKLRAEAMANQPATVGDVVHYWDSERCIAAIVTEAGVFDGDPDQLHLFFPGGPGSTTAAGAHNEGKVEDTWHWPESV